VINLVFLFSKGIIMITSSHGLPNKHPLSSPAIFLARSAVISTFIFMANTAFAVPFVDPVGDFIPSFVGPRNADLDVLTSEVTFQGSQFVFSARLAGPVGATTGSLYVLGLDRGAGTARFPVIAPGVLFDEVLAVTGGGVATVRDLIAGTAITLPAGATAISGNSLTVNFPVSLAPSLGLQPSDYTWNLWPRVGAGNNNQISDFAPDNSNVRVTLAAVPEPGMAALFGIGAIGLMTLRRRSGNKPRDCSVCILDVVPERTC
jgi:hypothetical protein